MPAGRGSQCERCYLEELADKRTELNRAAFSTPTMASHFGEFGSWLKTTRGPEKAAQKIHRFVPFFREIEDTWQGIPEYTDLVEHFGAKGLRTFLLAMRWMEDTGLVKPDPKAREAETDRRRIEATLHQLPEGSRARDLLEGYHDVLDERVEKGRTSTRSVRLAMAPAAGLMKAALRKGRTVPDQKVLDGYLRKTPGQRAAVSGFVTHLRVTLDTELKLPPLDQRAAKRRRRRKLREEMLELMRGGGSGPAVERRWMATALAYFHDVPRKAVERVDDSDIVSEPDGMSVRLGGRRYWIPLQPRAEGGTKSKLSRWQEWLRRT